MLKSLQLCLTLYNPMNCSPPGSSVHGVLQARILDCVAMPFFRGSSQPRGFYKVRKIKELAQSHKIGNRVIIWIQVSWSTEIKLLHIFSSVAQLCLTLCDPMNRNTSGLPVHHQLLESTQTHVYWDSDAIQPSHPLLSPSPPALNLSQHQGLFQWVSSSHQVAKVLEFQLQHQSFQWTPRTDPL